jgi:hypothetical protein
MKTIRAVLSCFAVLGLLAFATTLARAAGDTDCATLASCGFVAPVASMSGTLTGGGHNVSFIEQVYQKGSVFTYVFQLTNNNNVSLGIDFAKLFTNTGGGGSGDNFNCGDGSCLNYGIVKGGITTATTFEPPETGKFNFNTLSFEIDFKVLKKGQSITFYLQGGAPAFGTLSAGNGTPTNGSTVLTPGSEPGVVTLLGSSLLLVLGIPLVGRLRSREA